MKTNVLDISFLDEMATRPWFVMYNLFNSSAATSLVVMWMPLKPQILQGYFFGFFLFMYDIQHCFICLRFHCVRGCWNRTPGQLRLRHWLSDALTTRLDLIHNRLDLIHTRLELIHFDLSLTLSRPLAVNWMLFWSEESSFIDLHLRHTYKGQRKERLRARTHLPSGWFFKEILYAIHWVESEGHQSEALLSEIC